MLKLASRLSSINLQLARSCYSFLGQYFPYFKWHNTGCKTIENPLGTETTIWNKHNTDKNPNWPEAKQLAVYKHGQEEEQGSTEDKSSNQY